MKKYVFLAVLGLLVLTGVFGGRYFLFRVPYKIYQNVILEGKNFAYYKAPLLESGLIQGKYHILEPSGTHDGGLWKTFHLSFVELMLPSHDPQYIIHPDPILLEEGFTSFGLVLMDKKGEWIGKVRFELPFKLPFNLRDQKLFSLPIFKHKILATSIDTLWKDLFLKNLKPSVGGMISSEDQLESLGYNLFIHDLRIKMFNQEKPERLAFLAKQNAGLLTLKGKGDNVLVEKLYYYDRGYIYPVRIETDTENPKAKHFRNTILSHMKLKFTEPDSAIKHYTEHKKLPYNMKTAQSGMLFLYSAWSHDPKRVNFLKEIIFYLEKQREVNRAYLSPLYNFGYKVYGSSFSFKDIRESEAVKLERKTQEELEQELEAERNRNIDDQDFFQSEQDREKYILQKVKDDKADIDQTEDVLRMD